jgi:outer membrane protein OmpA-like peptidoglycan-associated protein
MPVTRKPLLIVAFALSVAVAAVVATPAMASTGSDHHSSKDGRVHHSRGGYYSQDEMTTTQGVLVRCGYLAPGSYHEGEYDPSTRRAVRIFQSNHGLSPTGEMDYETMALLSSHGWTVVPQGTPHASLFENGNSVVLSGVSFDTGTANLSAESYGTLDRVADSLKLTPDTRVAVYGYADTTNADGDTLALSRARSAEVCRYLVNRGVGAAQLQEEGRGGFDLNTDDETAPAHSTNRVEILRID